MISMNIQTHCFLDFGLGVVLNADAVAVVVDSKQHKYITLHKADAIALAKHFNLTASEMKAQINDELENTE